MISSQVRRSLGAVLFAISAVNVNWAAETSTPRPTGAKVVPPASSRPASSAKGGARGILPDPALLDGSAHPVEKKSEHGMIGDFELPGDENARSGKVGGQQNPNSPGGGGQQSNSAPTGSPQAGGAAGGQQAQQGGAQSAQSGGQQAGGGAQQGGPQNPAAGGQPIAGGGDPGAQPQGTQVSELGGAASGQQQGGGAAGPGDKPQQVAMGDSAMRIEQSASAQAGVVGAQQPAGHTQQHEKGTGSGGKGTGGASSGNRIEKGRVIPAGL